MNVVTSEAINFVIPGDSLFSQQHLAAYLHISVEDIRFHNALEYTYLL